MAVGTLASRVTGLLRTLVLVPAIGQLALANSYNYANTLPNTVYNLAIGGILTSVIVPLLVSAAKRDSDRGEKYDQRMFTLVTGFLLALTAGHHALRGADRAPVRPERPGMRPTSHVLVIFAYFFTPQIFFYGVTSLAGAILNARGSFAAPMWTPVVNNVVVIVVTVAFMVIAGTHQTGEHDHQRRGAFSSASAPRSASSPRPPRWFPRCAGSGSGGGPGSTSSAPTSLRSAGCRAGCSATCSPRRSPIWSRPGSRARRATRARPHGVGAGFSAYSYAWLLFQLPYAVIAISVITALLPRMTANAADRRYDLVRSDFSSGVRLGSVIVAPAALVLAALGPALGEILLGYGNNTDADARYLGLVFAIFSLGLMPYMLFQLLLRVFYAMHDSKTPALIGVVTMVTNVAANVDRAS